MPEIGETLREARMRARIDVSEIEARTKIRAKYLRALENEEWGLLPGPTFVKSFLRTYAQALGLDGKALVEEYRLRNESGDAAMEPVVSSSKRAPGGSRAPLGPSRGYIAVVGFVSLVIVLLVVGLVSGGGSSTHNAGTKTGSRHGRTRGANGRGGRSGVAGASSNVGSKIVSVSVLATGTVYVCLIGEGGRTLIDGKTLEAGMRTPTFTAAHFELTLGNNAVTLLIDGTPRTVLASSQAIGYSITKAGRKTLAPGHLPTCV
jgi:cytoskeleton protein RodZ